ncbi:hypothetical protein E1200_24475 [Actinomadura sp. GC306]|uniref:hypothetical protein n=1 Tax=Actinomadura sp. GC306 TaxID=2530367 RepID=UPI001045FB4D|nr:hypothetical protein [Actinomadura sp. GC306]TDC62816.1 hypothetical protein E1200_24475 [Actinomadura sp. GC306]
MTADRDLHTVLYRTRGEPCGDGLGNHLPGPAHLASAARPGEDGADGPRGTVRRLRRAALGAGGHDDVAVAVIACPPPDTSREPGR